MFKLLCNRSFYIHKHSHRILHNYELKKMTILSKINDKTMISLDYYKHDCLKDLLEKKYTNNTLTKCHNH